MATLSRTLVILSACMWVAWFDFGLQTPTGAFFGVMLDYYQSDRSTTASVFGLFTAINRGLGLPVGLLIQRFGIAKISFLGSVLVPVGMLLSVFATSIYQVLVFYGCFAAVGVSLIYICSATIVRQVCSGPYKKWLRICITLQSSCLSFAGFTYPYLIAYLNNMFALPGVFLIFGGILLNNACVSLLFYYTNKNDNTDVRNNENMETGTIASTSNETINTQLSDIRTDKSVSSYTIDKPEKDVFTISAKYNEIVPTNTCNVGSTKDVTNANSTEESNGLESTDKAKHIQTETLTVKKRIQDVLFGHVTASFACVFVATAIVLGTEYSFLALYIDVFESKGYSNELALNAYIPLQAFALICRLLPGLTDKIDPAWFLAGFSACGVIGQVVILFSNNYYVSLFGVGLCGMTLGGVVSAGTIEVATTVSKARFPVAFGQILTGTGLVATSIAPTYGALRDMLQNYDTVIVSTAVLQVIGVILFIIGWFCKRKNPKQSVGSG